MADIANPSDIRSLEDVRSAIDGLDQEIIELLARRSLCVAKAAQLKSSIADIPAPNRVEEVIAKVRAVASGKGLSPDVAEATYRAMIGAFIEFEKAAFQAKPA